MLYFDFLPKEINAIIFSFIQDESIKSLLLLYPEIITNKQFWKVKINDDFKLLINNIDNLKPIDPRRILIERLLSLIHIDNIYINEYLELISVYDNIIENLNINKHSKDSLDDRICFRVLNNDRITSVLKSYINDVKILMSPEIDIDIYYPRNEEELFEVLFTIKDPIYEYQPWFSAGDIVKSEEDVINLFIRLNKK